MTTVVVISAGARKDLRKCPAHMVRNSIVWVGSVQAAGLEATRRIPGYHDEPLKGQWQGYRSVRLSQAYRAICSERDDGTVEFAQVETVSKHRY